MANMIMALLLFPFMVINVSAQANKDPGATYDPNNIICQSCSSEHNDKVKIVDPSGNGDYVHPRYAAREARPGWVILVKNGTYNRPVVFENSGTKSRPIVMRPYPGHKPVFDFADSSYDNPRIKIDAEHIVFEGFEVRNGHDGVKIYKDNATINNNHIHSNNYQGILVVNASNTVITHNRIERNGVAPEQCIRGNGKSSPKHCHGIYFSNYWCAGANSNNTVKYNYVSGHGGAAVQFNGRSSTVGICPDSFTGNDISYNKFENNAVGMYIYFKFDGNNIRKNTFTMNHIPNTSENSPSFLAIWRSGNNNILDNTFHSNQSEFYPLEVYDSVSTDNNVNGNAWSVQNKWWKWDGEWRSDWQDYQEVSGWDSDGEVSLSVTE